MRIVSFVGCLILASQFLAADQPEELGSVNWLRDLGAAKQASVANGKPILLLFQEIPGCQTCKEFGGQPLSHPLLVEAMEDHFVPLAIYNNIGGNDAKVLAQFKEPSWNNPVIRYLDARARDLIPRKDRVWSTAGTAHRMCAALTAAKQPVPDYLRLVAEEARSGDKIATFAMHCYWEGEGKLGGIPGVKQTDSAWVGAKEVVHVKYDPEKVSYSELLQSATAMKCASTVFTHDSQQAAVARQQGHNDVAPLDAGDERRAKPSDQKYYLRQTEYRHLPLTALQATKINAALHRQGDAEAVLSPRQRALLERIRNAIAGDAHALDAVVFPEQSTQLAAYQQQLMARLKALES